MNKWMAWLIKQLKSMGRVSADEHNTRTAGVPSLNDQSRTVPIREIQPSHATLGDTNTSKRCAQRTGICDLATPPPISK
jgi:hypothetical protein